MNKLFLIGNGFDLAHGLKTRYTDFIIWYLNKTLIQIMTTPEYNDELIRIQRRGVTGPINNITTIQGFKNEIIRNALILEYKHPFIKKLIDSAHGYNWVDIESEYYTQLTDLYIRLENKNITKHPIIDKELKSLNLVLEHIKKELIEYLSEIEKNPKQKNEEIHQYFNKEIIQLMEENKHTGMYKGKILLLNFNYTSTIETYFNTQFPGVQHEVNYIHGKLMNVEKNPIIFGYGDEIDSYYEKIERLNQNEFLKHIKSFGYLKVGNYRNLSSFINRTGLNPEYEVFIMGHSCGLSDRILLNSIFENPNCKSIKIFYYQKDDKSNDFFEKTQEISRHFSSKGKEKMRIVIVPEEQCQPLTKHK